MPASLWRPTEYAAGPRVKVNNGPVPRDEHRETVAALREHLRRQTGLAADLRDLLIRRSFRLAAGPAAPGNGVGAVCALEPPPVGPRRSMMLGHWPSPLTNRRTPGTPSIGDRRPPDHAGLVAVQVAAGGSARAGRLPAVHDRQSRGACVRRWSGRGRRPVAHVLAGGSGQRPNSPLEPMRLAGGY